jgi:hypothetical protein
MPVGGRDLVEKALLARRIEQRHAGKGCDIIWGKAHLTDPRVAVCCQVRERDKEWWPGPSERLLRPRPCRKLPSLTQCAILQRCTGKPVVVLAQRDIHARTKEGTDRRG